MTHRPYNAELNAIEELSKAAPRDLTEEQLEFIFRVCKDSPNSEAQTQAAALLSHVYSEIAEDDKGFAEKVQSYI